MNNLFKKSKSIFFIFAIFFVFSFSDAKAKDIDYIDIENDNKNYKTDNVVLSESSFNEDVDKGGFWGWNMKINKFFSDNWNFFTTVNEEQSPIDILIEPDKQKESILLELRYKYDKQEEKSAIEMIKELILNVENYYEDGFIKKDWIAESLIKDLDKIILGLENINSLNNNIWFSRKKNAQEKSVILSLKKIVFKVRFYGNHIDNDVSNYIIKKVEEIEKNI